MKKLALVFLAAAALMAVPGCIGPMGTVSAGKPDTDGYLGKGLLVEGRPVDVRGAVGPSATPADWSDVPSC